MANLTENNIIDAVYSLLEGDNDGWETTSDEYLAARVYCNAAINLWEFYETTTWRELFVKLTDAADGDKTTSADTYTYTCPTDMRTPSSWVRINGEYYKVFSPEKIAHLSDNYGKWCYFTGSIKDGFTLNLNSKLTVTGSQTIEYEYYKTATKFTTTTSTTEVPDDYFIVYFVLARFLKNDGEDYGEERDLYENKLDLMQTLNDSGYIGMNDYLPESVETEGGFGQ